MIEPGYCTMDKRKVIEAWLSDLMRKRYDKYIDGWCRTARLPRDVIEDGVSGAMGKALTYAETYDPEKGDLAKWFNTIVRREIAQVTHQQRRTLPPNHGSEELDKLASGDVYSKAAWATTGLDEGERPIFYREALNLALGTIRNAEVAECMAMHYTQDVAIKTLAEASGINVDTLYKAAERMRERLRKLV